MIGLKMLGLLKEGKVKEFNKRKKTNLNKELNISCNCFEKVDLSGVNLKNVKMRYCHFHSVNLSNADLRGAVFMEANFDKVNLCGANVKGADFYGAFFDKTKIDKSQAIPLIKSCGCVIKRRIEIC